MYVHLPPAFRSCTGSDWPLVLVCRSMTCTGRTHTTNVSAVSYVSRQVVSFVSSFAFACEWTRTTSSTLLSCHWTCEPAGLWDRYHVHSVLQRTEANLWWKEQFDSWNPCAEFDTEQDRGYWAVSDSGSQHRISKNMCRTLSVVKCAVYASNTACGVDSQHMMVLQHALLTLWCCPSHPNLVKACMTFPHIWSGGDVNQGV